MMDSRNAPKVLALTTLAILLTLFFAPSALANIPADGGTGAGAPQARACVADPRLQHNDPSVCSSRTDYSYNNLDLEPASNPVDSSDTSTAGIELELGLAVLAGLAGIAGAGAALLRHRPQALS